MVDVAVYLAYLMWALDDFKGAQATRPRWDRWSFKPFI
jgi:hypothetical protein